MWCRASAVLEISVERAAAHVRNLGELLGSEVFVETLERPRQHGSERSVEPRGYRMFDELCLAPVAVRSHDKTPGESIGDVRTEVSTDDVHAKIDPGCHAT